MFLESIRIENGVAQHLDWHQHRVETTCRTAFGTSAKFLLQDHLPPLPTEGVHKLRIVYAREVQEVGIAPYTPRPVHSLKLVQADGIDYSLKMVARQALNDCFAQRGEADDVLIVRQGLLTDTSICNIALGNLGQSTPWLTPAQPLLPGTTRARLLAEGRLQEANLTPEDLGKYTHIALFNAMLPMGEMVVETKEVR